MASIKGVSLKSVKKTVGREGNGITANVYLNGKKVGEYYDYADGAMGDYRFTDDEAEHAVICAAFQYGKTHPNDFIVNLYKNDSERYERELKRVREYFSFVPEEDITIESMSYADTGIDIFVYDICKLMDVEKHFKKMINKGYKAVGVKGDDMYAYPSQYTDEMIKADGCEIIYRSLEDFNIA